MRAMTRNKLTPGPTLDVDAFTRYLRSLNRSDATIKVYLRHVRDFRHSEPPLREWLEARHISPSGFNQRCAALRAWGKHRRDNRLLRRLAEIDRPLRDKGLPR